MRDAIFVFVLSSALVVCFALVSSSTRTLTLICVKVAADRVGLQQALEQCQ